MSKNEEVLLAEMKSNLGQDGQLSCEAAHQVADKAKADPPQVGKMANENDIRITRCQLGLFGYAPQKGMPGYKTVKKLDAVPEPVSSTVTDITAEGKASCLELWRIAEEQNQSRPAIGNIVETLGIKVSPCQLGCF